MTTLDKLTWACEICHKERPDANISVKIYALKDIPGGTRNLKYCNDNDDCRERAIEKSKTQKI